MVEDDRSGETFRGEIHNYRNDYRFTFEAKQKADGKWQIGGKIKSDYEEGLLYLFVELLKQLEKAMEDKGFPVVKPKGVDS